MSSHEKKGDHHHRRRNSDADSYQEEMVSTLKTLAKSSESMNKKLNELLDYVHDADIKKKSKKERRRRHHKHSKKARRTEDSDLSSSSSDGSSDSEEEGSGSSNNHSSKKKSTTTKPKKIEVFENLTLFLLKLGDDKEVKYTESSAKDPSMPSGRNWDAVRTIFKKDTKNTRATNAELQSTMEDYESGRIFENIMQLELNVPSNVIPVVKGVKFFGFFRKTNNRYYRLSKGYISCCDWSDQDERMCNVCAQRYASATGNKRVPQGSAECTKITDLKLLNATSSSKRKRSIYDEEEEESANSAAEALQEIQTKVAAPPPKEIRAAPPPSSHSSPPPPPSSNKKSKRREEKSADEEQIEEEEVVEEKKEKKEKKEKRKHKEEENGKEASSEKRREKHHKKHRERDDTEEQLLRTTDVEITAHQEIPSTPPPPLLSASSQPTTPAATTISTPNPTPLSPSTPSTPSPPQQGIWSIAPYNEEDSDREWFLDGTMTDTVRGDKFLCLAAFNEEKHKVHLKLVPCTRATPHLGKIGLFMKSGKTMVKRAREFHDRKTPVTHAILNTSPVGFCIDSKTLEKIRDDITEGSPTYTGTIFDTVLKQHSIVLPQKK